MDGGDGDILTQGRQFATFWRYLGIRSERRLQPDGRERFGNGLRV